MATPCRVFFCPEYDGEWEPLAVIEDTPDAVAALVAEAMVEAPAGASASVERRGGDLYLVLSGPSD